MKCNNIMPGSLIRYGTANIFYLVTHVNKDKMQIVRASCYDKAIEYREFLLKDQLDVILK